MTAARPHGGPGRNVNQQQENTRNDVPASPISKPLPRRPADAVAPSSGTPDPPWLDPVACPSLPHEDRPEAGRAAVEPTGSPSNPDDRLALAQVVAWPGDRGRRLVADPANPNRKMAAEWVSVPDGVSSGWSFMVRVARNVLAVDADTADEVTDLVAFAGDLRADGRDPILVESGRGRHLFVQLGAGPLYLWRAHARSMGLDVRSWIRPPLAPHPKGLPVRLIDVTVADVLAAFPGPPSGTIRLSARMLRLLDGEGVDAYSSRSEAVQALATAAVKCGWTKARFIGTLSASPVWAPVVAEHGGEHWVDRSWKVAGRHVNTTGHRGAVEVQSVRDAMLHRAWTGPSGRRDRLVLEAHTASAETRGEVIHVLSNGDAAVAVGMAIGTVRQAHRSLEKLGWLTRKEAGTGTQATLWELRVPADANTDTPVFKPVGKGGCEDRGTSSRVVRDYGVDAYRWGALGKVGPEIVEALTAALGTPLNAAEIARRCPSMPHQQTVRNLLSKARSAGVATRSSEGWLLVNIDSTALDRLAEEAGTAGKREQQISTNMQNREGRRAARRRWLDNAALGPAVSEGPGNSARQVDCSPDVRGTSVDPSAGEIRGHPPGAGVAAS